MEIMIEHGMKTEIRIKSRMGPRIVGFPTDVC